eukprot:4966423-Pyramimonas_sp.AAC.1
MPERSGAIPAAEVLRHEYGHNVYTWSTRPAPIRRRPYGRKPQGLRGALPARDDSLSHPQRASAAPAGSMRASGRHPKHLLRRGDAA